MSNGKDIQSLKYCGNQKNYLWTLVNSSISTNFVTNYERVDPRNCFSLIVNWQYGRTGLAFSGHLWPIQKSLRFPPWYKPSLCWLPTRIPSLRNTTASLISTSTLTCLVFAFTSPSHSPHSPFLTHLKHLPPLFRKTAKFVTFIIFYRDKTAP